MKKILQLSILIVLLSGCFKNIDIFDDSNFETHLVVNSITSPDNHFKVYVSRTAIPKQLDSTVFVLDAKVEVYENNQLIETLEHYYPAPPQMWWTLNRPYYTSDFIAQDGHTYTIKIEALGKTVEKEFSFPEKVKTVDISVTNKEFELNPYDNGYFYYWLENDLNITINDPAGKNYYMIDFYAHEHGFYLDTIVESGDTLIFPTDSVISLYTYYHDWYFNDDLSDIQNITGGMPDREDGYSYAYILNDELFSEQSYNIQGLLSFYGDFKEGDDIWLYYRVITISEDLFNFFVTAQKAQMTQGNPFVEPVNVYSNIEGDNYGLITGINVYIDSLIVPINY